MRIQRRVFLLTLCLLSLTAMQSASAQKAPEIAYVYPAGGPAGSTLDVQLGGYDWTSDMELFSIGSSISIKSVGPGSRMLVPEPPYWFGPKANSAKAFLIPREFPATFTVPADTPPGPVYWQAANANGTTKVGIFIVGNGPEIVENPHRLQPQQLPSLPVVVNGRILAIEEVDRYRLSLPETALVTVKSLARSIGSPLYAALQIHNQQGERIAEAVDTEGMDTSITFLALGGEQYQLSLHDLDFRGNRAFVYRLQFSTGPQVVATIPAVVQRGATTKVEFIGHGLKSGRAQLESFIRTVTVPAETTENMFAGEIALDDGESVRCSIPVSGIPENVSRFDNSGTTTLSVPSGMTARFTHGAEQHFYSIVGKVGEHWAIAAEAWRFGSLLDLSIELRDTTGSVLANSDDLPHTTDAGINFDVPADGEYTLVVTDTSLVADRPTSIYRLSIEKPTTDFTLSIPQAATILTGDEYQLPVQIKRTGSFAGPVILSVSGLPPGITAPVETVIEPGQAAATITLQSDGKAAVHASLMKVTGTGMVSDQQITRVANATTSTNPIPRQLVDLEVSTMLLAVTMKPRADVGSRNPGVSRTAHRGTTYPAEILVRRHEGYDGPVLVRMSAYQQRHRQGMDAEDLVVPAGIEEAVLPCYLPEWLETNRTSRMRMVAIADVPDPEGIIRQLLNYNDDAISLSLEGALLKLSYGDQQRIARPGDSFEIPLHVLRAVDLPESVLLELVVPPGLAGLLEASPVEVAADKSQAVITVTTKADARLSGMIPLVIRGTALQRGKYPAISQASVEVFFKTDERANASR